MKALKASRAVGSERSAKRTVVLALEMDAYDSAAAIDRGGSRPGCGERLADRGVVDRAHRDRPRTGDRTSERERAALRGDEVSTGNAS